MGQLVSLREMAQGGLQTFLRSIGFTLGNKDLDDMLLSGLTFLVNEISDYYEEGTKLSPEIIITDSADYFQSLSTRIKFSIYTGVHKMSEYKRMLKMCAPLAVNGWKLYLIWSTTGMEWGVFTTELSEVSISIGTQLLYDTPQPDSHVVYLHSLDEKNVLLQSQGNTAQILISPTLDEVTDRSTEAVEAFVSIVQSASPNESFKIYLHKLLKETFQEGHGNLFVVVNDDKNIPVSLTNGISLLQSPIDLYTAFIDVTTATEAQTAVETNYRLLRLASLAKSMMNHDGISVFSNTGKLLGFHYIVDNSDVADEELFGGARTRAYQALLNKKEFLAVFMKKQEGEISCKVN